MQTTRATRVRAAPVPMFHPSTVQPDVPDAFEFSSKAYGWATPGKPPPPASTTVPEGHPAVTVPLWPLGTPTEALCVVIASFDWLTAASLIFAVPTESGASFAFVTALFLSCAVPTLPLASAA